MAAALASSTTDHESSAEMQINLRPALRDDADLLARIIDLAGEGLPRVLWADMGGPDADPWDIGRARAQRDSGGFSWCNAIVAELDGAPAGAIITYLTGPAPEPPDADTPPIFVPLMTLEALAPDTRYINALAVLPGARRRGVAQALLATPEPGPRGLSLIVTDTNTAARALYARLGFAETARRPVVAGGWRTAASDWVLMTRPR
jgi:ribosomal protein S18 acetylase RimI-like enzyme